MSGGEGVAVDPAPLAAGQSLRRKLTTAGFSFSARGLEPATTFILTILAARFIQLSEYGVYTLSAIFVTFVQALSYSGYYQFVVTQKGDEKPLLDTLFWLIMGLSTLSGVVLWLAAPGIAALFGAPEMEAILKLFSYVQPFSGVGVWCSAVLMRRQQFTTNYAVIFAANLAALVGGVVLLIYWQSIYALVAYRYIRIVSAMLLYLPLTGVWPGFAFRRGLAVYATRYAGGLYGTRTMYFMARYGADIVLGLMFTTAEAGLYRFGDRLASGALDILQQPLVTIALAKFGLAGRKNRPFQPVYIEFSVTMTTLVGIGAVTIAIFAAPVLEIAFQPAYLAGAAVATALAMRSVLQSCSMLVEPALAAQGRISRAIVFACIVSIAQVGTAVAVSPFGLATLAWSQAAASLLVSLWGLVYVLRPTGISLGGVAPALLRSAAVVGLYAIAAFLVWQLFEATFGAGLLAVSGAVVVCGLFALGALVLATWARALHLSVFAE